MKNEIKFTKEELVFILEKIWMTQGYLDGVMSAVTWQGGDLNLNVAVNRLSEAEKLIKDKIDENPSDN